MAEIPPEERELGNPEYWHRRFWEEDLAMKTDVLPFDATTKDKMIKDLAAKAAETYAIRNSLKKIFATIADWTARASGDTANYLTWVTKHTTGIPLGGGVAAAIARGSASAADLKSLNESLQSFFGDIFNVAKAANDAHSRLGGEGSLNNLFNFMAFNVRTALAGEALAALDTLFIGYMPDHVKQAGENLIKSIGIEDAAEELFQALIDATITKGVERELNRQIQPVDLGSAEAIQAHIEGRLDKDILTNILKNEGIRVDVHETMIERAAKNLTQSDLQELFQRGVIDDGDVFQAFRFNTFAEPEARHKSNLIVQARERDLEDDITKSYLRLFRDGVVTESELRVWLGGQNYSAREMDLAVQSELLRRRYRSFLSRSDLDWAVDNQIMVPGEAAEYLRLTGYTPGDAGLVTLRMMQPKITKAIKTCFEKSEGDGIRDMLSYMSTLLTDPSLLLNINFAQLIDCLTDLLPSLEGGETPEEDGVPGVVDAPKIRSFVLRPSSVFPGEPFLVEWEVTGADRVAISPLFGDVADLGSLLSSVAGTTPITLTATGPGGTTERVRSILVKPAKPVKVVEPPRPQILSFGVSPGVIKRGEAVDIRWRAANATSVVLYPEGVEVGREGSRVVNVDRTQTFSVVASGPNGSDSRNDSVIVRAGEPDAPPIPRLPQVQVFSVSPGRMTGGGPVEVQWRVREADTVFIEPLVGEVAHEGSVVRGVEATTTFRLTARNLAGTEMRHESVIVTPRPVAPEVVEEPPTIHTFSLRPATISGPADIELQWRVSDADTVEITPDPGSVPSEGSRVVRLDRGTTFQLIARGPGGIETRHETVLFVPKKEG